MRQAVSSIIDAFNPVYTGIKSSVEANYQRWKELPIERKVHFTVGIVLVAGSIYLRAATLPSQAKALRSKHKKTLLELINDGVVCGLFTYDEFSNPDAAQYYGRFVGNRQSGTYWDTISKEWDSCWRRIVGVQIDGSFVSTPRSILRGLWDGSLHTVGDHIRVRFPGVSALETSEELNKPLESQASKPRRKPGQGEMVPSSGRKPTAPRTTITVDAGAHHSNRFRVARPTANPFDMNKIYYDSKTAESDKKFLKVKFADLTRGQFATGSSVPVATQLAGLTQTMREARIVTDMGGGILQEETKLVPIEEEVDESVV